MKNRTKTERRWLTVIGAREHNLKNITVRIPKEELTVITGPSGSGKSSLAFDILFTEGQRRYIQSLSSYARQFLGNPKKPDVDAIEGLCPAIAIDQKTVGKNPRSTVGTITEVYDYLRVLFARTGVAHCIECDAAIQAGSAQTITDALFAQYDDQLVTIAAPIAIQKKGTFAKDLGQLFGQGFYRFLIDDKQYKFSNANEAEQLKLEKNKRHTIHALIDAVEMTREEAVRVSESIEKALMLTKGFCTIIHEDGQQLFSTHQVCVTCRTSFPELDPRLFSFNSPVGACKGCQGLGKKLLDWVKSPSVSVSRFMYARRLGATKRVCDQCHGRRLNRHALSVRIGGKNIMDVGDMSVGDAYTFFEKLKLTGSRDTIAKPVIKEVVSRLSFLNNVGLTYLTLNREAATLSGGEGQRIRLATQIGAALSGVMYILDEPSIGLHQRDNDRLIQTLKNLRDMGNTVIVVEHDQDTMLAADYIIDMGPASGIHGGQIVAQASPKELQKIPGSLTGQYLAGKLVIPYGQRRKAKCFMELKGAKMHNLKNLDVRIPLGVLCGISGVSGSGKSSLIMKELVGSLAYQCRRKALIDSIDPHRLIGAESIRNMVVIDQSPIGRTPRSNPATYLKIFDIIRGIYSQLPESIARGYKPGRFSFNVRDGRCKDCSGEGKVTVSMQMMPDVVMDCKACKGRRYARETLEITFKGKSVDQILAMTALEALNFFTHYPALEKRLKLLCDVGLEYLTLGQPSTTLSGGEAQRIKLVEELAKRSTDTIYILDEPTTGLHSNDIKKLLKVLNTLIDKGNSMLVIEHNLDVLKSVDYLIDLGPEGGDLGGHIVAQGTPEQVAASGKGHTSGYLQRALNCADGNKLDKKQ
ncbi:excinuclease ABC subunit UvrA [bacterium]|nr:excinuclease ABC subunit UvrA [bacterium]